MNLKEQAFVWGLGRRKTSVARVRIYPTDNGKIIVNGKDYLEYFPRKTLQIIVEEPLITAGVFGKVEVRAKIIGGGISSQAGALSHGIARALFSLNPELKMLLKSKGLLTRDSRMKERRKYGLQKARKAPQYSKR
ncbi:ribosomal protein S9 [Thermodesulfobium narugense DSM 14796]|uniref:Small ribosomal subunit protein uS9 n=1 Tax=Thermodesulfobium narugense DSM 14796 TaxID=747365 RepID=M1E7W8_9BACT|nr:30S ribosomal protein S9 [Thermodesulfobium narugense]AEE14174.1 ribosomal protein S9 [Thermodesulfobium narugense DSM 14796]